MAEEERSPTGSPIYRHKARSIPFQPTHGDGTVIDAIDQHIASHLGPVEWVFHEIVSDLIHLDVHVVAPRDDRPFYTLVASGMSEAPMTTPPQAEPFRFAELMICLPGNWPLGLDEPDLNKSPLKDRAQLLAHPVAQGDGAHAARVRHVVVVRPHRLARRPARAVRVQHADERRHPPAEHERPRTVLEPRRRR
jgi:hypothetical protein